MARGRRCETATDWAFRDRSNYPGVACGRGFPPCPRRGPSGPGFATRIHPCRKARIGNFPWRIFLSELVGTAVLLLVGLSLVIFMFGAGSPMERIAPSLVLRQTITGFLFGCVGATIALSSVGKESGAHINPAVTLGFWLMHKLDARTAVGYVFAQLIGACVGCLPLLAWGSMGRSVNFGPTVPGEGYTTWTVLMGEAITTFGLVAGLPVHRVSTSSSLHTSNDSVALCPDGAVGGVDIRHQHQSSPHLRSGSDIRTMAGMVDLLGWPAHRHFSGNPGLQFPGAAN
jgi:glycerol uptake facilitator-like aquaporin